MGSYQIKVNITSWGWGSHCSSAFLRLILQIDNLNTFCETGLKWVPERPIEDKSTLNKVMACAVSDLIWQNFHVTSLWCLSHQKNRSFWFAILLHWWLFSARCCHVKVCGASELLMWILGHVAAAFLEHCAYAVHINPLSIGRCDCNFKSMVFKLIV